MVIDFGTLFVMWSIWIIFWVFVHWRIHHIHSVISQRYKEDTEILRIQKYKIQLIISILLLLWMMI